MTDLRLFKSLHLTPISDQTHEVCYFKYTLTELCDTELEYSRALRQLSDILDSLNGKIILNYSDNSEKILDYPKPISDNIKGLQDTLKRIIQFCGMFLEKLPLYSSDPGKSAECFTKTIVIGGSQQETLDPRFMLLGTRQ
ncbi:unnamed protein product [Schistosoma mattheei]|uniref:Uncharacterized protein n=1 Tax=Schistosoma mattheei TaxID=31246 RepID=A0A183PUT1_9TREM|nr:unnamed protein product [Schistosoma mattheei]